MRQESDNNKVSGHRLHNEKNKLVTLDTNLSFSLFFNISNGELKWVKDKQSIYVDSFRTIPGLKMKKVELISDYPGDGDILDNIVPIFNTALGYSKETLNKYIRYGVTDNVDDVDEVDDNTFNESMIYESGTKSTNTNVGNIIFLNNIYYLICNYDESKKTYDLIELYDDSSEEFMIKKVKNASKSSIDKQSSDNTDKFLELIANSDNEIFGGKDINSFKLFSEKAKNDFDSIIEKPRQKFIEKVQDEETPTSKEKRKRSISSYESDDIYNGKNIEDYKNIFSIKNDSEILIYVNNLHITRNIHFQGDDLEFTLNPEDTTVNIINYREAKKTKILVNNYEIRPKSEIGFLQHILPFIKIKIFLDK